MQTTTKPREATPPHKEPSKKIKIIDHQRNGTSKKHQQEPSQEQDKPKRRRGPVTHLHATGFAGYAQEPRMWQAQVSKQQKSDATLLVVFLTLSLEDGITLDTTPPDYCDRMLDVGKRAEKIVFALLAVRGITSMAPALF
ncbi:hypothetical protein PC116_g22633 [Phytophthora cactorum]|nr:hypothetical protein PC116_g22633 [Phytophthora cactorum]